MKTPTEAARVISNSLPGDIGRNEWKAQEVLEAAITADRLAMLDELDSYASVNGGAWVDGALDFIANLRQDLLKTSGEGK